MSRARGKNFFSLRGAAHRAIILASSTLLGGLSLHPARLLAAPVSDAGTVAFQIPPQPLATALTAFGTQSGWAVSVPNALLAGLKSPGVQGRQPPASALAALLAGTGLSYQFTGPHSVILQKTETTSAIRLGPVRVQGQVLTPTTQSVIAPYAGGQVAQGARLGLFGNRSILDTPFNMTSYTSQLIKDQQARGLADLLANDASVRTVFSETGYIAEFTIRGFMVSPWDVSMDGLYGLVPPFAADINFADRVEVLKGTSAFLNGMAPFGSIGGTINIVPKRAQDKPNASLTFLYTSRAQFGGELDLGRRFGHDGAFGIRLTGGYRAGDIAVDHASQRLGNLALALDYRSSRFRSSIDLGYQNQIMYGSPRPLFLNAGVATPKAPSATSNWLEPWNYTFVSAYYSAFHAAYDLTRDWTLSAAAGLRRNNATYLFPLTYVTNNKGDLQNYYYSGAQLADTNTERVTLKGKLSTWIAKHDIVIDASRYYNNLYSGLSSFVTYTNLYNPVFASRPSLPIPKKTTLTHSNLSNVAIGDTISFLHDHLQIFAGGRWQRVESVVSNHYSGAVSSRYNKGAVTPAVGVVIKLDSRTSIYGNYMQALQQGTIVGTGYANTGYVFPPYKSTQLEIGVKHDFGRLMLTADYFQITQPSTSVNTTTNMYVLAGSQRNRGFEINGTGKLTRTLRVIGGAMWINGILHHTTGGLYDGNQGLGTPHLQLNANIEWDVPYVSGLTLTGRSIYTSSQYYDLANTQKIPGWVRFDIGARYRRVICGKTVTFRGDIHNIGGSNYWASAFGSSAGLTLGAPRTFLFSATTDF